MLTTPAEDYVKQYPKSSDRSEKVENAMNAEISIPVGKIHKEFKVRQVLKGHQQAARRRLLHFGLLLTRILQFSEKNKVEAPEDNAVDKALSKSTNSASVEHYADVIYCYRKYMTSSPPDRPLPDIDPYIQMLALADKDNVVHDMIQARHLAQRYVQHKWVDKLMSDNGRCLEAAEQEYKKNPPSQEERVRFLVAYPGKGGEIIAGAAREHGKLLGLASNYNPPPSASLAHRSSQATSRFKPQARF